MLCFGPRNGRGTGWGGAGGGLSRVAQGVPSWTEGFSRGSGCIVDFAVIHDKRSSSTTVRAVCRTVLQAEKVHSRTAVLWVW